VTSLPSHLPEDIETLRAALAEANTARLAAEAELALARSRMSGAEALIQQLKLTIAKYKREKYGADAVSALALMAEVPACPVAALSSRSRSAIISGDAGDSENLPCALIAPSGKAAAACRCSSVCTSRTDSPASEAD
jgi:hypothetical protein